MNALDLYCCAGGATRGLQQAGVHVVGVDIKSQPRYCGDEFIRRDVLALKPEFLNAFDFIWASPPCQALSEMKVLHNAKPHLNLIPQTRALLIAGGRPYCIENVRGARSHLINPFMHAAARASDSSARGRELKRHRLFETSFPVVAPPCRHSGRKVLGIYGGHVRNRQRDAGKNHRSGSNLPISVGREAMEIDWMSGYAELSEEAIPPAYSRFIAEAFLNAATNSLREDKMSKPMFTDDDERRPLLGVRRNYATRACNRRRPSLSRWCSAANSKTVCSTMMATGGRRVSLASNLSIPMIGRKRRPSPASR